MLFSALVMLAAAHSATADLQKAVTEFAGQPVGIDPRLRVPQCAWQLEWRDDRREAIVAHCPEQAWRAVLPMASARPELAEAPSVRRGDPVTVEVAGNGYRLQVDGVADGPVRPGGRVVVRNLRSGRKMIAEMGADHVLRLAGK